MRVPAVVRFDAGPTTATRPSMETLRWEWRTFTKRADTRLASLIPAGAVPEPSRQETYILSAHSPDNVKARGGFIEVKTLERGGDSGLELWRPTLRAAFPITVTAALQLFAAWRTPVPQLVRETYTLDELVKDIVGVDGDLAAIQVSKRRTRISPYGCVGEFVELTIRGESWWTVAIESTDPNQVAGAVVKLGLAGFPTSSYPAALKSITRCFPAATKR